MEKIGKPIGKTEKFVKNIFFNLFMFFTIFSGSVLAKSQQLPLVDSQDQKL